MPLVVLMIAALVYKEKLPGEGELEVLHALKERGQATLSQLRASVAGGASKSGVGLGPEVVMHLQIATVQEASDLANF